MKGAICSLLASALILSAGARAARADKPKKAVVEQFSGKAAEKFKHAVVSELGKQGIEVVSDKKRAATEAELGLLNVSDNYAAVAKELGAGAFIDGTITGTKHLTARLKVKGPDGSSLGGASWSGANEKKLLTAIDASIGKKLAAIFNGGAAKEEAEAPVAAAKEAPAKEAPAEAAEEAPKKKSRKSDDDGEKSAAKSGDAEAVVAEEPEAARRPSRMPTLDVSAGAHVYGRNFSYNQSRAGGQQAYHLPAVPAPTVNFDYFFLPNLGLFVGGEYSVALISEDSDHNRYRTGSMAYWAGVKGRFALGSSAELVPMVGYVDNSFKITPESDDNSPPQVAAVEYKQIRAGVDARIALGSSAALIGGGHYLHLLGMGEIKDVYFPFATGRGGEGFAGIAFALPFTSGLEGRITGDIRRYAFSMNSAMEDLQKYGRIAGGAVDQYVGVNLALGLRR